MSLGEPRLALARKSGNFGAADFFQRAFSVLDEVGRLDPERLSKLGPDGQLVSGFRRPAHKRELSAPRHE